jgi:hypothetical protein
MAQRIILKNVILSYPHFDKPVASEEGGKPKFSAAFILTKDSFAVIDGKATKPGDLKPLKAVALATLIDKLGKEKASKLVKEQAVSLSGGKNSSLRTDVAKYENIGAIAYINARSTDRPGLVNMIPDSNGRPMVIDHTPFYAGAIVNASVTSYYYDVSGNKGAAWALNNVQFVRDGAVRLDNRVSAENEFEADPNAVAQLEDLTSEALAEDADTEDVEEEDLSALLS